MHTPLAPNHLLEALNWRYATKIFDPEKKIATDIREALLESLVLTPSSFGLQPWKFIVVDDPALRARLRAESWDQHQITDAAMLVVLTARETITDSDIDRLIARTTEVRGQTAESLAPLRQIMAGFAAAKSESEQLVWNSRQVYIALGQLMAAAAALGVDSCPLEGISPQGYDEILGLTAGGYRTMCVCALGYRAESDKYATAPKVRHPREGVVEIR